jgi:hypothetical protein
MTCNKMLRLAKKMFNLASKNIDYRTGFGYFRNINPKYHLIKPNKKYIYIGLNNIK